MSIKKNKLKVIDNDGTIHLDWEVNNLISAGDRCEESFDKDKWYGNNDAIWDLFQLGLVIQMLAKNIQKKTPKEYKKYFYNKKTLKSEDPEFPKEDNYLNRLKIFERVSWIEDKDLYYNAKQMTDFYSLWEKHKFGYWKFEVTHKQKRWKGRPPFKIHFEWEYPDFITFERFSPEWFEEDLFYLCLESSWIGEVPYSKFYYLSEYELNLYEKKAMKEIWKEKKVKEEKWIKNQGKQIDLL